MNQRVLCIWLPNWPMQRVLAAEPSLAGRPVVLEARDARRGLLVMAANLAARQGGAKVGMRMSELATLRMETTEVAWEVRAYRPDDDLDALCDLAEQAQQFSPLVGLELHDELPWCGRTSCQPQSLLLDVSGIAPLFGGEKSFLNEIAGWLQSKRYFAYMCIASNVGAAWALANYELVRRVQRARKASMQSGQSSFEVPPSIEPHSKEAEGASQQLEVPACQMMLTELWEEAELLSELPIAALRVDDETVAKLRRLGVSRLNQLWQLPRDGLASRLGSRLLQRSDQALGCAPEPVTALHGTPDWMHEFSLEHPTLALETLGEVIRQLCGQLTKKLTATGQGALRCLCRLDLVRCPPLVMQLGLFRATDDASHLHALLIGQLEHVLLSREEGLDGNEQAAHSSRQHKRPRHVASPGTASGSANDGPLALDDQGLVWRVSLQATLIGPIIWQQSQLFDESNVRTRQQLAQLVDTLSGRLGRNRVVEACVERDAQPEQAVSYRSLTGRRNDGVPQQTLRKINSRLASSAAEPSANDPLRRPTQLLSPPEPLLGVDLSAEGMLREFVYENCRHRVVEQWGPERLESGWWRGPSMRREYYRMETTNGSWWWIYCELATGRWYVHGLFG